MSFDTTINDIEERNVACHLFEFRLEKKFLSLPCRNDMFELVIGAVFKL